MAICLFLVFTLLSASLGVDVNVIQFEIPPQKEFHWHLTTLNTATANFSSGGATPTACSGIYKHMAWVSKDVFYTFCVTGYTPSLLEMNWKTGKMTKNITNPLFGSPGNEPTTVVVWKGKLFVAAAADVAKPPAHQNILTVDPSTGAVTLFGTLQHTWNSYPGYGTLDTDKGILYIGPEVYNPFGSSDSEVYGLDITGSSPKLVSNWTVTNERWVPADLAYNPVHKMLYAVGAIRDQAGTGQLGIFKYTGNNNFEEVTKLGKCIGPCIDISQRLLVNPSTGDMYFTWAHDGLSAPQWRLGTIASRDLSVTSVNFTGLFIKNVYLRPPFTVWSFPFSS